MFDNDNSQELSDIEISENKIFNKILKLTDGKAPGDDGLTPQFLKQIIYINM
jgi:hypothetical protein